MQSTTSKPDNSQIVHMDSGTVIEGNDAMLYFKAVQLRGFIRLYMKTGIIPTRGVGIKRMLELCAEITKPAKPYKASDKGQSEALTDLCNWCDVMKSALPIVDERTK